MKNHSKQYLLAFIDDEEQPRSVGFIIAVSFFVVNMLEKLFENVYFERMNGIGIRVRSALCAAIYRPEITN